MKKIFLLVPLLLMLVLTSCGKSQETNPEKEDSSTHVELLQAYLQNSEEMKTPVREFGDLAAYIQFHEDLMIHVSYPENTVAALDEEIYNWITDTVSYYQIESRDSSKDGDSAELTAGYDSYLVNDQFVSVKIAGLYDKPYMAHPIDVVQTFHANLQTKEILSLQNILLEGGYEALQNMVITDTGLDSEKVDEHLLDKWVLTSDGLEVILERGSYLPMSDGTVTLFYKYEQLENIISLDAVSNSTHADTPEETPNSSDTPGDVLLPSDIDPDKPMVALTFDDGPSKHTAHLLDIFATEGGKGTFFVVGNLIDGRAETVKRMAAEGHEVAGHSWDHRQLTKLGVDDLKDQIMTTRAKIYDVTGVDATLMRPPYGSYNDTVKDVCSEYGISMINWSLDTLDWKYRDASVIYETIMKEVSDGDIILCHDLHGTTVDAMERVIPALIEKGYQLVTVSELLTCGGTKITAGQVYNQQ